MTLRLAALRTLAALDAKHVTSDAAAVALAALDARHPTPVACRYAVSACPCTLAACPGCEHASHHTTDHTPACAATWADDAPRTERTPRPFL